MKLRESEQTHRSKIWEAMNELDYTPQHFLNLKYTLNAAIDAIQHRDYDMVEKLHNVAMDLADHYCDVFEKKFQVAWSATLDVADIADNSTSIQDKKYMTQYTDEELEAMCNAAESTKRHSLEAQLSDAIDDDDEYLQALSELNKNKTWVVPIEQTPDDEYLITFPDELVVKVGWVEGDTLEWIDNKNGSFTLKKLQ
jgi:hypothetical protein